MDAFKRSLDRRQPAVHSMETTPVMPWAAPDGLGGEVGRRATSFRARFRSPVRSVLAPSSKARSP